jgi:hypothetical protein
MATLERHGQLSWITVGADKRSGPYAIVWGPRAEALELFGKAAARKSGSQPQLKAYYQSAAAWWALNSLPSDLFEDRGMADKVVAIAARTASSEFNKMARSRREFDTRAYNMQVQSETNKRVSQYAERFGHTHGKPAPEPPEERGEPEGGGEKLSWRTAASGRLDAFSSHGSYHISTPTPRGYQLRWMYKDQGAMLGEFATIDQAKRAAEKHHERFSQSAAAEPARRRYRRR